MTDTQRIASLEAAVLDRQATGFEPVGVIAARLVEAVKNARAEVSNK